MAITFSKGEESKKRVLNAALELFVEQGYEKTTMRQIVQKSGVLNGSVYHAFKNKDALFEKFVNLVLDRFFDKADTSDMDPVTFFLLPATMQLKASACDKRFADILYHANRSWDIYSSMADRLVSYYSKYFEKNKISFSEDNIRRYVLASMGMVFAFASEYYFTDNNVPVKDNLRSILDYTCSVLHIPVINPDETLDRVLEYAKLPEKFPSDLKF